MNTSQMTEYPPYCGAEFWRGKMLITTCAERGPHIEHWGRRVTDGTVARWR